MEYSRVYERDSEDEDNEPLIPTKSSRLMEEEKTTLQEEEADSLIKEASQPNIVHWGN